MTAGLWLVLSSAYVDQELSAEFGRMPPAFLPIGTQRLFELQLAAIGGGPVYVTLPEHYPVSSADQARLLAQDATPLPIPEGLRLGEAVVFALNLIGGPDQPVRILHGDTLIDPLPVGGVDEIGVAMGGEGYSWAEVTLDGAQVQDIRTVEAGGADESGPIACGVFAFGSSSALVRSIVRARGDFIGGLRLYAAECPLRAASCAGWLDFGHLQTFFRSRRALASARSFNTLQIDDRVVRKTSADADKMAAEAAWLADLPPDLRVYTARLVDRGGQGHYTTEYEYLPTLAELFVFGALGPGNWRRILQACRRFLEACAAHPGPGRAAHALHRLTTEKTAARLRRFADQSGFDLDQPLRYADRPMPSLMQIAERLPAHIAVPAEQADAVMHGDFCFSNILYNARAQRIRVIDPRGTVPAGAPGIHGPAQYDIAKFSHSVQGRYDQIIAGRYHITHSADRTFDIAFETAPHHDWIEQDWARTSLGGIGTDSPAIRAITVGLFLSMLPLHADRPDRQRAFIANALRLFRVLDGTP